ncbi:hypothetical protein RJ640_026729 [Escallonia rubra]|uniref:Uncharacterized protein n=1 Tax=Escallonia rubra TaxID=112253 RepID=A0AA88S218_9ASTE|nr:hypothetical protein RJ640_026729 [Escallonia rubra]
MSGGERAAVEEAEAEEEEIVVGMGSYGGKVRMLNGDPSEEMMLLWCLQQPTLSKNNALVRQSSNQLHLDACGRSLSIHQSPSSLGTPGVTGAVMWDSGVVLGKFLEYAVEVGMIGLQGKKVVELGSGCGLVGCIAALLGAQIILTDMPDRLRLLKKNIEANLYGDLRGSAIVNELVWGDDPDPELCNPLPDYVLGSDVIYSEGAVMDLLTTLVQLCGTHTTIILAGELRNGMSFYFSSSMYIQRSKDCVRVADAILEYFLEAAMKEFSVGRIDQAQWHPEYCSARVVIYVMVKKSRENEDLVY